MSTSTEKAALTREENSLRTFLNDKLNDRGLWQGLPADDLERNKNFKARVLARLEEIQNERRVLEKKK